MVSLLLGMVVQDIPDAIDVTVPVQIMVQRGVHKKTGKEIMKIELPGECYYSIRVNTFAQGLSDDRIAHDRQVEVTPGRVL
jgi:hypothetical protein